MGGKTPKRKTRLMACLSFLYHRNSIDAGRTWGPAQRGGAFAPYKCFCRRRKPWRRGNSFAPSILISHGIYKNSHTLRCGYFYGGGGGSRTPVRKLFHGNFSGRRRLFRESCSPCSLLPGQAVTPGGQVSFIIHGRRKALPAHVHH